MFACSILRVLCFLGEHEWWLSHSVFTLTVVHFQTMICGLRSSLSQSRLDQETSMTTTRYMKNSAGSFLRSNLYVSVQNVLNGRKTQLKGKV